MYQITIDVLLNFGERGEEVAPFGNLRFTDQIGQRNEIDDDAGVQIPKKYMMHHTKDNFLVHCNNPIKIIIILLS